MAYRIKTVSELTGIPKNTLVAWERRYNLLSPERQPNGYRLYTDRDLATLVQIKSALAEGLKISEAVDLVNRGQVTGNSGPLTESEDAFEALRDQLRDHLLHYDRGRAESVIRRLVGVSQASVIERVYYPLLREIGVAWESGDVSVAQEHYASAFVREQLTAMLIALGCGPVHGTHVVCTTLPGDAHELGALGLAVRLAASACRVTYLGANMPLGDLGRFAAEQKPAWVCVSAILPVEPNDLLAYARGLHAACPTTVNIAIGGAGLPDLANTECHEVAFWRDWKQFPLLSPTAE